MPPKTPVEEPPSGTPPSTSPPRDDAETPCHPPLRTRSGRTVKPPERYSPQEVCDDDYASDEYDSYESDVSSEVSIDPDDISSESDADDEGNLAGFVVKSDDEDIDSDVSASGGESEADDEE